MPKSESVKAMDERSRSDLIDLKLGFSTIGALWTSQ